jgi:hypothetical protein
LTMPATNLPAALSQAVMAADVGFAVLPDGRGGTNNNLRDWLDEGGGRLPKGKYGVEGWVNDPATVARVRELYPPSSKMRVKIENDRRIFLGSMAQIKQQMVLGVDKNVYVEPAIWTIEWARNFYKYPVTRSN